MGMPLFLMAISLAATTRNLMGSKSFAADPSMEDVPSGEMPVVQKDQPGFPNFPDEDMPIRDRSELLKSLGDMVKVGIPTREVRRTRSTGSKL